jgi:hypothetical protein|tara:strand:+ start:434 stop:616 length:183 start_codon:yes stop_codon:yes gene_type:complete
MNNEERYFDQLVKAQFEIGKSQAKIELLEDKLKRLFELSGLTEEDLTMDYINQKMNKQNQ